MSLSVSHKLFVFFSLLFLMPFFVGTVFAQNQGPAGRCTFTYEEKTVCATDFSAIPQFEKDTNNFSLFCRLNVCRETGVTNCSFEEGKQCDPSAAGATDNTGNTPAGYSGPIPDCAFSERGCRDINDLVELAINIGKFLFSILGSVAFVMFIYGGVTMITSFGNAEKFKQGQNILVAAVIGIIISLSAYIAVDFLLDALRVSNDFRAIQ